MSRSMIIASLLLAIGVTVAACKPAESGSPAGSAQGTPAATTSADQSSSTTTTTTKQQ